MIIHDWKQNPFPFPRFVALLLTFSLILGGIPCYPQLDFQKAVDISIPEAYGRVEEAWIAPSTEHRVPSQSPPKISDGSAGGFMTDFDSRFSATRRSEPPFVIYLQDAHDSLEAQENIAKIIHHLVERAGVHTVFEEGYEGPVPTDKYFGIIKNPKVKEKVSYFLLDKLRLGGAEYAHINRFYRLSSPHGFPPIRHESWRMDGSAFFVAEVGDDKRRVDFDLIGVDDLKLHLKNIRAYQKAAKVQSRVREDLEAMQSEITRLVEQYFPKEMKEWLKLRGRWEKQQIGLVEYVRRMANLADPRSKMQDPSKGNPSLPGSWILDPTSIFENINRLENDFVDAFLCGKRGEVEERKGRPIPFSCERDRKIFEYYKDLELLKRLNELKLSAAEYDAVVAVNSARKKGTGTNCTSCLSPFSTEDFAKFLAHTTKNPVFLSKMWERRIRHAISFYEIARKRDEAVERHLRAFNDVRPAILVFGGFHKDRIRQILRKLGVSYLIVTPRISKTDEKHQNFYRRLMSGGRYSFEAPISLRLGDRTPSTLLRWEYGEGGKMDWRQGEVRDLEAVAERTFSENFAVSKTKLEEAKAPNQMPAFFSSLSTRLVKEGMAILTASLTWITSVSTLVRRSSTLSSRSGSGATISAIMSIFLSMASSNVPTWLGVKFSSFMSVVLSIANYLKNEIGSNRAVMLDLTSALVNIENFNPIYGFVSDSSDLANLGKKLRYLKKNERRIFRSEARRSEARNKLPGRSAHELSMKRVKRMSPQETVRKLRKMATRKDIHNHHASFFIDVMDLNSARVYIGYGIHANLLEADDEARKVFFRGHYRPKREREGQILPEDLAVKPPYLFEHRFEHATPLIRQDDLEEGLYADLISLAGFLLSGGFSEGTKIMLHEFEALTLIHDALFAKFGVAADGDIEMSLKDLAQLPTSLEALKAQGGPLDPRSEVRASKDQSAERPEAGNAEKASAKTSAPVVLIDFPDFTKFSKGQLIEIFSHARSEVRFVFAHFDPADPKARLLRKLGRILTHSGNLSETAKLLKGREGTIFYLASAESQMDAQTLRLELRIAGVKENDLVPLMAAKEYGGTLRLGLKHARELLNHQLPEGAFYSPKGWVGFKSRSLSALGRFYRENYVLLETAA